MNTISSLVFAAMVVFFAIAVSDVRAATDYKIIMSDAQKIRSLANDITTQSIAIANAAKTATSTSPTAAITTATLTMVADILNIVIQGQDIYLQLNPLA